MQSLSERLLLIAEFAERGSAVCDVGTDHGYLSAFLYLSGKFKSVIATDIKQKPLLNAKSNLEKLGANGVTLKLCDGLEGITREMADTVIIAGMGGEVISGIIDRAPFVKDATVSLILQPMTAAAQLREYLARNGFEIEREEAVSENGKIYSVMKARFSGAPYKIDCVRAAIGLLDTAKAASREYINKQYRIAFECANQLKNIDSKRQDFEDYKLLADSLKQILEE